MAFDIIIGLTFAGLQQSNYVTDSPLNNPNRTRKSISYFYCFYRVLDLELKKEETKKKKQDLEQMSEDESKDSDNEEDIDEFLDWRAKKSYT